MRKPCTSILPYIGQFDLESFAVSHLRRTERKREKIKVDDQSPYLRVFNEFK